MGISSDLQGSTVLVTGGLGFIGSHLVRRLLLEGCAKVHIIGTGPEHNLADVLSASGSRAAVQLHKIDVASYAPLAKAVRKISPRFIFHLAAKVNVSRQLDEAAKRQLFASNVAGTANLLQACEAVSYDRFVNTGTCEEYGTNPVPFTEDQQPTPVSPYSQSKVQATQLCQAYYEKSGRPVLTVRPFLTYGPFQSNTMLVPYVITSILLGKKIMMTKGEQGREFNYVSDIVEGYLHAATSPRAVGHIINIGNGKEYAIKDVVSRIIRLMDAKNVEVDSSLPYRAAETMHFYCSNVKARTLLGWHSKVSLTDGLKKTIGWYKSMHKAGELEKWIR